LIFMRLEKKTYISILYEQLKKIDKAD